MKDIGHRVIFQSKYKWWFRYLPKPDLIFLRAVRHLLWHMIKPTVLPYDTGEYYIGKNKVSMFLLSHKYIKEDLSLSPRVSMSMKIGLNPCQAYHPDQLDFTRPTQFIPYRYIVPFLGEKEYSYIFSNDQTSTQLNNVAMCVSEWWANFKHSLFQTNGVFIPWEVMVNISTSTYRTLTLDFHRTDQVYKWHHHRYASMVDVIHRYVEDISQ